MFKKSYSPDCSDKSEMDMNIVAVS